MDATSIDDFLEQLIIRRELAINFVYYNDQYRTSLESILPSWAWHSLKLHKSDPRKVYTLEALESGTTVDVYFNAAQLEMVNTGHMNGYEGIAWIFGKHNIPWKESQILERLDA